MREVIEHSIQPWTEKHFLAKQYEATSGEEVLSTAHGSLQDKSSILIYRSLQDMIYHRWIHVFLGLCL